MLCAVSGTTHGMFTLRPGATITLLIHTVYSYRLFVPFIRTVYTDGGRGDGGGAHAVHDAR